MKKILSLIFSLTLLCFSFAGCQNDDLEKIEVNEVTHSVFYAPLYIAIENGYFEEEGLKIVLTNGGGADNSMTAVLSKSADIGLMGPETVIYVQKQNKKDAPKVFAQLTQKDGSFLVSRNKEDSFKWENLKGKDILAGRRGGVPAMTFEYMLHEKNLTIDIDYTLNFNVQFNLMTSAFIGGTSDYCTVFEPTASEYQKAGTWYIVGSVGKESGNIPYTSFIALDSFLNNNKETVKKFLRALQKGMNYLETESEENVAKSIIKQFPNTELESIKTAIISYKNIEAWKTDLIPEESSYERLQDIMTYAGELDGKVPFKNLINLKSLNELVD